MNEYVLATEPNQTIARKNFVLYLNIGTKQSPNWAPIGRRVTDSTMDFDWSEENNIDIFDTPRSIVHSPTMTQSFSGYALDSGDEAMERIWEVAIAERDVGAMTEFQILVAHLYAELRTGNSAFGEMYDSCTILPESIGGEGGGNLQMPINITIGGERTTGSIEIDGKTITFTPDD